MLFMLLAYLFKYKSIIKNCGDDLVDRVSENNDKFKNVLQSRKSTSLDSQDISPRDIWSNKKSDDYLRYLKWEAFNFSYLMAALLMDL